MKSATLKKAGFSKSRMSRLNTVMQRYIDEQKFAGIVTMIARYGDITHFEAFGLQDMAANKPMALDTIFRIYSMTKPITSVAAMMLFEEGHFQLSDPISRFIPAFKDLKVFVKPGFAGLELAPLQHEITIRDLFTHTSGLTYGFFENSPIELMYREAKLLWPNRSTAEMIEELVKLPLICQPGTAWQYSVSTDVLGHLVEVISGRSLADFFEQCIFKPLGMNETGFYVPKDKWDRFAPVYTPVETGGLKVLEDPGVNHFIMPCPRHSGGGGLVSTAADYMRFCQMLLNKGELEGERLLSRKTVELMTLNHLPQSLLPMYSGPDPMSGNGFGLGFRVVVDVAQTQLPASEGTYGWGGAANTHFWIDPKEELIAILMTQFMPSGRYPLTKDFTVLTYQAIVD